MHRSKLKTTIKGNTLKTDSIQVQEESCVTTNSNLSILTTDAQSYLVTQVLKHWHFWYWHEASTDPTAVCQCFLVSCYWLKNILQQTLYVFSDKKKQNTELLPHSQQLTRNKLGVFFWSCHWFMIFSVELSFPPAGRSIRNKQRDGLHAKYGK